MEWGESLASTAQHADLCRSAQASAEKATSRISAGVVLSCLFYTP